MSAIGHRALAKLGDAHASLNLSANGPVGLGHPALIQFNVHSLTGVREVELWNLDGFCSELTQLHQSLRGSAKLTAQDHELELMIQPQGSLGRCRADVTVAQEFGEPIEFKLTFKFDFDQSYLPSFIAGLKSQFEIRGV